MLDFNVKELSNGSRNMLTKISQNKVDQILAEEWEKVKDKQKKAGMIAPDDITVYDFKISFASSDIAEEKVKEEFNHLHSRKAKLGQN